MQALMSDLQINPMMPIMPDLETPDLTSNSPAIATRIAELNRLSQAEFVEQLGAIFEHTPAIAHRAWEKRPFSDAAALQQALIDEVYRMQPDAQMQLIQAHPDLGSKAKMAEASVQEQSGAGLDRLSAQEYERFCTLNQAYKVRFGFPFIIAVKHHTKDSILAAFAQRLENSASVELETALKEIIQIAILRLTAFLTANA